MATPVVTVASGGMPVVDVTAAFPKLGLPVTEAPAGRGMAVTKVAGGGMPVTYSTVADYPPSVVTPGVEAAAFLARTSGLDAAHTNDLTVLINGLVAKNLWAKFDVLHYYTAQNTATAQLNLVSTSYPAILSGTPPVFTPDSGYDNAAQTGWIDTNFTPSTAPSPKYTLNSAHMSFWGLTNNNNTNQTCGIRGAPYAICSPRLSDLFLPALNEPGGGLSVANTDARGHYIASRTGATAMAGYKNGVSVVSGTPASTALPAQKVFVLAENVTGSPFAAAVKGAMFSLGAGLNPTEALDFFTLSRAFMTARGVP